MKIGSFIRGSVKVEVAGRQPEELLNLCAAQQISIWEVNYTRQHIVFYLHVNDFFRLRPLLKQTGCRVHVLERSGLPFYLQRLEKRKAFAVGLPLFILGLYMLSSLIWSVSITGNEKIPTEDVLQAAAKHGVRAWQWKFKLEDPATLSRQLMSELPEVAWVGIKIKGTHVQIEIVEAVKAEDKKLYSPRHLVSTSDAVVTEIFTERGKPLVQPNSAVKQGQILISGIIGNEEDPEDQEAVTAKGTVKGLVLYEYHIEMPLKTQYKVYTGQWHTRKYVVIGDRGLQLTGYGQHDYEQQEVITQKSSLHWRNVKLPFGWQEEKVMETKVIEEKLSLETAKEQAMQLAASEVLMLAGEESTLTSQKILQERTENGKVYIDALFEVNQNIATERVLIPDTIYQGD